MSNVTASSGFIHVISVRSVRTLPTAKAGTPNKSPGEWGPIAGAQALRQVMVAYHRKHNSKCSRTTLWLSCITYIKKEGRLCICA